MSADGGARVTKIDAKTVRDIANLARLGILDDEVEAFSQQMTTIIDFFNHLGEVDVTGVPPANLLEVRTEEHRADEARPSLDRESFLSRAPARQGDHVKIAPVFED